MVRDSWLDNQNDDISIVEYVINIRTNLAECTEISERIGSVYELFRYSSENVETWKNVSVSDSLLPEQQQCIEDLLSKYSNVFSDQPFIINAAVHHIDTEEAKPVRLFP